jgi:hypothetical protein
MQMPISRWGNLGDLGNLYFIWNVGQDLKLSRFSKRLASSTDAARVAHGRATAKPAQRTVVSARVELVQHPTVEAAGVVSCSRGRSTGMLRLSLLLTQRYSTAIGAFTLVRA